MSASRIVSDGKEVDLVQKGQNFSYLEEVGLYPMAVNCGYPRVVSKLFIVVSDNTLAFIAFFTLSSTKA